MKLQKLQLQLQLLQLQLQPQLQLLQPRCKSCNCKAAVYGKLGSRSRRVVSVKASSCNSSDEPILREALKEPVAFLGGLFAGLLRLDLNEDPLKEWISRTVEASGLTAEEVEAKDDEQDNVPEEIEIE
ncbi:hypothetical protein DCAR_0312903 [Daucus carota subsp. sativus]|uniref:Uncharacterized protein n=1 Tax=Daucus carota subsp. sativus TaxID=79200 RepID=A0AAF1AUI2_DAUCS|nr:hypothetical protein DCAR_0312903 [Daucus carota subsp. sativus]